MAKKQQAEQQHAESERHEVWDEREWAFWQGGTNGHSARVGCFVSIAPCGTVLISRELAAQLDAAQPNCRVAYSPIRKALRIFPQAEIAAGTYRWFRHGSQIGRFAAPAALRDWGLRHERVTLYRAAFHPAADGRPAYIEVDLSAPMQVLAPRAGRGAALDGNPDGMPEKRARVGKCPDCGRVVGVTYDGGVKRLKPHDDPSGIACECRRPMGGTE